MRYAWLKLQWIKIYLLTRTFSLQDENINIGNFYNNMNCLNVSTSIKIPYRTDYILAKFKIFQLCETSTSRCPIAQHWLSEPHGINISIIIFVACTCKFLSHPESLKIFCRRKWNIFKFKGYFTYKIQAKQILQLKQSHTKCMGNFLRQNMLCSSNHKVMEHESLIIIEILTPWITLKKKSAMIFLSNSLLKIFVTLLAISMGW